MAAAAPAHESIYRPHGSEENVMFEQLALLMLHAVECHDPACHDCRRLALVKTWLLAPFK